MYIHFCGCGCRVKGGVESVQILWHGSSLSIIVILLIRHRFAKKMSMKENDRVKPPVPPVIE